MSKTKYGGVKLMAKQNSLPSAIKSMGEPSEMSPIKDVTNIEFKSPILEVQQPLEVKEPLEIRKPSSVTVI